MTRLLTVFALLLLPWFRVGAISVTTFSGTNGSAVTSNALNACTTGAVGTWKPCTNITEPQTNLFWTNGAEWVWREDAGNGAMKCLYDNDEKYYEYWFANYPSNCTIGFSVWLNGTASYHWYDLYSIIGEGDYAVMSFSDMPSPGPYITLHGGSTDSAKWPIPTNTWLWVSIKRLATTELSLSVFSLPDLTQLWTTNWLMSHTNYRCQAVRVGRTDSHGYGSSGQFYTGLLLVDTNQAPAFPLLPSGYRYAATAQYGDVTNAYAKCSGGDTLVVPSGTVTWTNELTVTNGLRVTGSGSNATVITAAPTMTNDGDFLVTWAPYNRVENPVFRLTGMTLAYTNAGYDSLHTCGCLAVDVRGTNVITGFKVTSNLFLTSTGAPSRSIWTRGNLAGLVNRNATFGSGLVDIRGDDLNSWNWRTFAYGTTNSLVFEDDDLSSDDTFVANGQGAWVVYRHNIFRSSVPANLSPALDVHGNQTAVCATMGAEVYVNLLLFTNNPNVRWLDLRGGKTMSWSNWVDTRGTITYYVREEYDDSLEAVTNTEPMHVNDTYSWWNTKTSGLLLSIGIFSDCCGVLVENSTHWNHTLTFDGSVGVGVGLLAARPATCTTGVGYWATDSNVFYRATAPNTWSSYYTPLVYPHPLSTAEDAFVATLWGGQAGSTNSSLPSQVQGGGIAVANAVRANVGRIISAQ
jgi:hypothetical protein